MMSLEVELAILVRIYPEGGRTSVVIYSPTTAGMYLLSTQDRIRIVSEQKAIATAKINTNTRLFRAFFTWLDITPPLKVEMNEELHFIRAAETIQS